MNPCIWVVTLAGRLLPARPWAFRIFLSHRPHLALAAQIQNSISSNPQAASGCPSPAPGLGVSAGIQGRPGSHWWFPAACRSTSTAIGPKRRAAPLQQCFPPQFPVRVLTPGWAAQPTPPGKGTDPECAYQGDGEDRHLISPFSLERWRMDRGQVLKVRFRGANSACGTAQIQPHGLSNT